MSLMNEETVIDNKKIILWNFPNLGWEIANICEEVFLGFFLDKNRNKWWHVSILQINGRLQRVFLERLICSCGWHGITANPFVGDIYLGSVGGAKAGMENAKNLALLGCPKCNKNFRRPVIWHLSKHI